MDKLDIKSRSHNCSERFFYKIVVLVSVPLKSNTVNTILVSTFHSKVEAFYGNNFLTCLCSHASRVLFLNLVCGRYLNVTLTFPKLTICYRPFLYFMDEMIKRENNNL